MVAFYCWLGIALLAGAGLYPPQADGTPELVSPLGTKFFSRPDEKGDLAAAAEKSRKDPGNVDLIIALGRAQGEIWQMRSAIATYSKGIELAPANAMLYRHRGHRYISIREFRKAEEDLDKAAKLNSASFDIWYHLGLARYLQGDFSGAARAYEECLKVTDDPTRGDRARVGESLVAVADWLYMTYRRAGRDQDAAKLLERIHPSMNVSENKSYYERLLFYKGLKKEEELLDLAGATDLEIATRGYGVANWHFYSGRRERAQQIQRKIVSGAWWPAFGFIAAEADLVREKRQ